MQFFVDTITAQNLDRVQRVNAKINVYMKKKEFVFPNTAGREGTLDCKLNWYPKVHNYVIIFLGI